MVFFHISLFLTLSIASNAAPVPGPIEYSCWSCGEEKFTNGSSYSTALDNLLATLITNAPVTGFFQSSVQSAELTLYGLLQCRQDMSRDSCDQCARDIGQAVKSRCSSSLGAKIQLYGCFLRYENHPFFSVLDESLLCLNCSSIASSPGYDDNLKSALATLSRRGSSFTATVGSGKSQVFVLGECRGDLSSQQCDSCVRVAMRNMTDRCIGNTSGSILLNSCYTRFDAFKFYSSLDRESRSGSGRDRILKLVFGIIGGALLLGIFAFCCVKNRHRLTPAARKKLKEDLDLQANIHHGATIFSYHALKTATNSFSDDNKLGQGGFGVVYKGTLPDGRRIAIKRLTTQSQKGKQEFLNEVKLVSSVQHRNLVKLYGCCTEESERLLVYELLENNSLSRVLFQGNLCLSWEQRYNVILGVARGLAYLHEDSQVKIIHRDIKAGNVLLDEKFEAKIADFGLARLYSDERSINTQIAGTLGYMAPEYALHGHLTDKADVFSFGILSLEIVSGRRSTDLNQPIERQYLLEWAWKSHERNEQLDLVDAGLNTVPPSFDKEQAIRVICVGLLCTQATPSQRPSMSRVVTMICGEAKLGKVSRPAMVELVDGVLKADTLNSSYSSQELHSSQCISSAR
ncbi:cysteine-rich receptor-like protein kinase 2 [Selaginella moellendorffii]|nr:cysteine-rich receptor-like protein kinase 2 [Selaginella moellendorffii]|eukprot:XP_002982704.2 cysteine-rich receptor-like protein kinase 2 [Selaginella moellendorffii]